MNKNEKYGQNISLEKSTDISSAKICEIKLSIIFCFPKKYPMETHLKMLVSFETILVVQIYYCDC